MGSTGGSWFPLHAAAMAGAGIRDARFHASAILHQPDREDRKAHSTSALGKYGHGRFTLPAAWVAPRLPGEYRTVTCRCPGWRLPYQLRGRWTLRILNLFTAT